MPRSVGKYDSVIAFYEVGKECDWMANTFRGRPVQIGGATWPTTEHYFQAMKFSGSTPAEQAYQQAILNYNGSFKDFPKFARQTANSLALDRDWKKWDGDPGQLNGESHQFMREALRAKLQQHSDLLQQLLSLPINSIIVEATEHDSKWADANNGSGTNHLGILLMSLLQEFNGKLPTKQAEQKAYQDYQTFNDYRQANFPGKSLYDPAFNPKVSHQASTQASSAQSSSSFQQHVQSAKERVLEALKYDGAMAVAIVPDNKLAGHFVVKLTFDNNHNAQEFAAFAGNAPCDGKSIIMGAQRSQQVFNKLKLGKHGKTNPHDMFDALVYEEQQARSLIHAQQAAASHSSSSSSSPQYLMHQGPKDRVLDKLKKFGAIDLVIADDQKVMGQHVIKVHFNSPAESQQFAKFSGNAFVTGNTVILGPVRAQEVFKNLDLEKHGKTNPHSMFDALVHEDKATQSSSAFKRKM